MSYAMKRKARQQRRVKKIHQYIIEVFSLHRLMPALVATVFAVMIMVWLNYTPTVFGTIATTFSFKIAVTIATVPTSLGYLYLTHRKVKRLEKELFGR